MNLVCVHCTVGHCSCCCCLDCSAVTCRFWQSPAQHCVAYQPRQVSCMLQAAGRFKAPVCHVAGRFLHRWHKLCLRSIRCAVFTQSNAALPGACIPVLCKLCLLAELPSACDQAWPLIQLSLVNLQTIGSNNDLDGCANSCGL